MSDTPIIHEKVHNPVDRPIPVCVYCNRPGHEIQEYQDMAWSEKYITPDNYNTFDGTSNDGEHPITDQEIWDWIWANEGTLNSYNGHIACTDCYIKIGQPSSPRGWRAP